MARGSCGDGKGAAEGWTSFCRRKGATRSESLQCFRKFALAAEKRGGLAGEGDGLRFKKKGGKRAIRNTLNTSSGRDKEGLTKGAGVGEEKTKKTIRSRISKIWTICWMGYFCLSLSSPMHPPPAEADSVTEVYVQVVDLGSNPREQE